VNGRCPKKPRAALASAGLVGGEFSELGLPRSKSGKSAGSSLFEKVAVGTGKSTAQAVVHQIVPKITPRLSGKMIRAQARAAVTGTKANISQGVLLAAGRSKAILAKLAAPVGALTGTTVALALGAGLAAYAATTAILNHIKDAKERKQQAAFEAAQAYRKSRLEAERLAGRPLTAPEQQMLSAKFKEALANVGYRG